MNIRSIALLTIFLTSLGIAYFIFPYIQYPAVSHWDASGVPDGFVMPFWAAAFGPLTLAFLLLLWWGIPKIDPFKENIKSFRALYDTFWILVSLLILYVYTLTLYWNTGTMFNMTKALAPALAIFFIATGYILPRTKRNWFMGIRTPWTLASDSVWKKTHELGGKLFIASGAIILLGFFFPEYFLLTLLPLGVSAIGTMTYSYLVYKKENE